MKLKTNGYYITKGIPFEDWQSGHKFEGKNYAYIFFRQDGKYFLYYGREEKIKFNVFSEDMGYGIYTETENGVDTIFQPNTRFPAKVSYRFISPNGLESESDKKRYFFCKESIELLSSTDEDEE